MRICDIETEDLIRELTKRIGPAAFRTHRHQLEALAFIIDVESREYYGDEGCCADR
jgi:hypothetical protein